MVSTRLEPLRTLSYCEVVTFCAPARSPSSKAGISRDSLARDLQAFTKLLPLSCRQIGVLSFQPKRGHRVDTSCPLGRNPDGEQGNRAEKQRRDDERDGIPRLDTKEKAGQEASEPERCADAQHHACDGEDHALADYHVAQVRCLRSKRHAYAKFLGALLDGIGHDSIDTNGGHHQSCRSKDAK